MDIYPRVINSVMIPESPRRLVIYHVRVRSGESRARTEAGGQTVEGRGQPALSQGENLFPFHAEENECFSCLIKHSSLL